MYAYIFNRKKTQESWAQYLIYFGLSGIHREAKIYIEPFRGLIWQCWNFRNVFFIYLPLYFLLIMVMDCSWYCSFSMQHKKLLVNLDWPKHSTMGKHNDLRAGLRYCRWLHKSGMFPEANNFRFQYQVKQLYTKTSFWEV